MPSQHTKRAHSKKGETGEKQIEKKRQSHPFLYIFSVIILVIILVTFVGGPALSRYAGRSTIVFGSYMGKPIEFVPGNFLSRQKDLLADQLREQEGDENIEIQAYRVWRGAFDQTVLHTAFLYETEKSMNWVSEDRLDATLITAGPYTVNGVFSEDRYNSTSNAERSANRKFFREQIFHEQYLQDIFASQQLSNREADFVAKITETQRSFYFVRYQFSDYPHEVVAAYAGENRDLFKKIKLSSILIKNSSSEAEEIRKKLSDRTSSFEELARAHSKDNYAEKGGNMDWRYYYDLERDFEEKALVNSVFELAEGQISDVLENRFGWVIYRCDNPQVSMDLESQESIQVVDDYLMRYERGMVEDYFLNKAEEFTLTARQNDFFTACGETGLTPYTTEFFPLNYQNVFEINPIRVKDNQISLASASSSREFFLTAFSLKENEISDPVPLDDVVIVLKLQDEKTTPEDEEQPFSMQDYYRYLAGQSLQLDLQTYIMDAEKLEDNFNSTFYQYIMVK